MIKKMKYINWDTKIFAGFYDSYLYNNDMLYNLTENNDSLAENEYYDFKPGGYAEYEQAVSRQCVKALFANLCQGSNKIIQDMEFVALHSPKYYNFETDKLEIEITLDWDKLLLYIQENRADFAKYLQDNFTSYDGFVSFVPNNYNDFMDNLHNGDFERLSQVCIEFYILDNLDAESYEYDCFDIVNELFQDYVEITKE